MVLSKDEILYLIAVVSAAIFLLIFLFVVVVIANVRRRQKAELEKLHALIAAEDNERSRIAKDLHDDLGPLLSGIKLQINLLNGRSGPQQLEEVLNSTSEQLDSAIGNVRYVVRNLMPPGLEKYGLVKSISDFQNLVSKNENIKFEFKHSGIEKRFKGTVELTIFRIIHELINNSIKHSNCSLIKLDLILDDDWLKISYKDDGKSALTGDISPGMGLSNIESRVNLFNGKFKTPLDFSEGADYEIEIRSNKLF
ncbi:MAG: hypothetical protein EYC69_12805 [Bacteroidetes bacterium]|nr:MAG: hypothetical protein EYC69_12805 [Bacteroidota bacterium]